MIMKLCILVSRPLYFVLGVFNFGTVGAVVYNLFMFIYGYSVSYSTLFSSVFHSLLVREAVCVCFNDGWNQFVWLY